MMNGLNGNPINGGHKQQKDDEHEEAVSLMQPLEVEMEQDSLIHETADFGRSMLSRHKLVFRKNAARRSDNENNENVVISSLRGILRDSIGNASAWRNFAVLAVLCLSVMMILKALDYDLLQAGSPQDVTKREPGHSTTFGFSSHNPGHHSTSGSGIGGINDDEDDELIPKSNVGVAVQSKSRDNVDNWNGHYWHDPNLSPFCSWRYKDLSNKEKEAIENDFHVRMNETVKKFGQWHAPNMHEGNLVSPDFSYYDYKDMPVNSFPHHAWQSNRNYTLGFLQQAKGLVNRVRDGIAVEYGLDHEQLGVIFDKSPNFAIKGGVAVDSTTGNPKPGVAFLNSVAWEGLIRKLLHAMTTQDDFYAVVVGGPHTYRAVNFWQTQIMRFNEIMEPVFDKLGVTLISRNMGMAASSTISALGGADVYGEADVLWYILNDDLHPETSGQVDLLQRQAILAGARMPVILTPNPVGLAKDAKGRAWIGNIQQGSSPCEETSYVHNQLKLPTVKACEYVNCDKAARLHKSCNVYNSVCWVNRTGWNPSEGDTPQDETAGFQDQGYPSWREHQWEGRKLALVLLQALDEAIDRWTIEATEDRLPLAAEFWHVGPVYDELRESIRSLRRRPGETAPVPPCETLLTNVHPMICHLAMHVYTEWTPRVNPASASLSQIVIAEKTTIADNSQVLEPLYAGVDVLPQQWRVSSSDQVDVHLIAIATSEVKTDDEDAAYEDDYSDDTGDDFSFYDDDDFEDWGQEDGGYDGDYDDMMYDFDDAMYGSDGGLRRRRSLLLTPRKRKPPQNGERKQEDEASSLQHRSSAKMKVSPTKWTLYQRPIGFCDGSAQSICNRRIGNTCLLANRNDYSTAGLVGHGNSDWLYLKLQGLREGVILIRLEFHVAAAENGDDDDAASASPGAPLASLLPDDFRFDYSIDGAKSSLDAKTLAKRGVQIVHDLTVYPLLINEEMAHHKGEQEDCELGIRFRTAKGPDEFNALLTHVYFA